MKVRNLTWPSLGAPTAGTLLAASPPFVSQPQAQEKKLPPMAFDPSLLRKDEPSEAALAEALSRSQDQVGTAPAHQAREREHAPQRADGLAYAPGRDDRHR